MAHRVTINIDDRKREILCESFRSYCSGGRVRIAWRDADGDHIEALPERTHFEVEHVESADLR